MKSEYARSHRGFAATVAGLMAACFLSLSTLALAAPGATHSKNNSVSQKDAAVQPASVKPSDEQVARFLRAPLTFEVNQGQADSRVKFSARGQGYGIFLTESEMVLALHKGKADAKTAVVRMKLAGANPVPRLTALDKLPGDSVVHVAEDAAGPHQRAAEAVPAQQRG